MKTTYYLPIALVGASIFALSACGDDGGSDGGETTTYDMPVQEDYDDMAVAVGSLVSGGQSGEVRSMEDSVMLALGSTPFGLDLRGELVLGDRAGLSYSYTLECSDASGAEMACGGDAARAYVTLDWEGEVNLPRYQASVDRSGWWALTELQTETPRFDGEGRFVVQTSFSSMSGSNQRSFFLDYAARYDDIVWDREAKRPTQGSIHYSVIAEREASGTRAEARGEVDARFKVQASVVFTSEGNAMLVLDNQVSYWLNLETGSVERMQ